MLRTVSVDDSGRLLQIPREVSQIVGGQNVQSMRVKNQILKKISTFPGKIQKGTGGREQDRKCHKLSEIVTNCRDIL